MNPPGPTDPLETLVHRTLSAQPLRRAPHTLESRVLAELARRAALPWWKQSYQHWPAAVRGSFLVLSALVVALLGAGVLMLTRTSASAELTAHFTGLALALNVLATLTEKAVVLWRAIPPLWFYSALTAIAFSYTALVTVGTATYRAFFAPR